MSMPGRARGGAGRGAGGRLPAGPQARHEFAEGVDLRRFRRRKGRPQQQQRYRRPDPQGAGSDQPGGARRWRHLMSAATCTLTILWGSVTAPPAEPDVAFFSLSTTSMPCTTSPITVYWPSRLGPSANMMKNCELAESTLSPRRAIPTMPRWKCTLENPCFRFGYFDP